MKKWVCPVPWQHLEIGVNHQAYLCCHIPTPVGNLAASELNDVWNSPTSRAIRQSILDGDYAYCRKSTCPAFHTHAEDSEKWRSTLALNGTVYQRSEAPPPLRISLANDRACNLNCPSCRNAKEMTPSPGTIPVWRKLRPILASAERLKLNGSGEWLVNPMLVHFVQTWLREFPSLKLELLSNLTLLSPRLYSELGLAGRVASLWGSIDAFTPETYSRVRGGNFRSVRKNLKGFADLRSKGENYSLTAGFVVSALNFEEIPRFCEWIGSLGANAELLRIQPWGHLDPVAFAMFDVANPSHPRHSVLLVEIMKHPILDAKHVRLGDLGSLRKTS